MDTGELRMLDRVAELIRDSETRLLKVFHGYVETNETRIGNYQHDVRGLRGRVVALENRVAEVEKRLNLPPE